jgi:peroxiredoxin
LRSFQRHLADFDARGVRVAAVSADAANVNSRHATQLEFTFPLLADPKLEVIKRYHLLHTGGGPDGADIARPAEFLIDSSGVIRWENFTESFLVRARPGQIVRALDQAKLQ